MKKISKFESLDRNFEVLEWKMWWYMEIFEGFYVYWEFVRDDGDGEIFVIEFWVSLCDLIDFDKNLMIYYLIFYDLRMYKLINLMF